MINYLLLFIIIILLLLLRMLSASEERCHCQRRDAVLKLGAQASGGIKQKFNLKFKAAAEINLFAKTFNLFYSMITTAITTTTTTMTIINN